MASATDVAKWVVQELNKTGYLPQSDAAYDIQDKFGDEFVYDNENGNLAIFKRSSCRISPPHRGTGCLESARKSMDHTGAR